MSSLLNSATYPPLLATPAQLVGKCRGEGKHRYSLETSAQPEVKQVH